MAQAHSSDLTTIEQMKTHSHIASFPAELLDAILGEYRPVYNAEKIEVMPTWGRKAKIPQNWAPYAVQLRFFSQLRLVCKTWYHFITPLLYSTFTLPTHPYEDLERVSKGLSYYPGLIDHLVLRGHTGSAEEQHAAELLAACLSQCVNLRTLEILNANRIFQKASKSKCLAIFRALPSTVPLHRLVFRFPRRSRENPRLYTVSTVLLGLGPLVQNITTLEIHDPHSDWSNSVNDATLPLPSALPKIERMVTLCGIQVYNLPKLLSRVFCKGLSPAIPSGPLCSAVQPVRSIPLHDLTLFWDGTPSSADFISTTLEMNRVGQSLTTLCIQMNISGYQQESCLPALPGKIVAACPRLETLIYFPRCPDTIFALLPRTLRVLGISLDPGARYAINGWQTVKPLSPANCDRLVNWLETMNGRGIDKLLIQHTSGLPVEVKQACEVTNVKLFEYDKLPRAH